MSRFTRILVVSPYADGRTWVTRQAFGYDVGSEDSGDSVEVPVGFQTDFTSVPRPLWWWYPPWGKYGNAAVIHDFLYWSQERPRVEADRIFREGMEVLGVSAWTRAVMYWGVRLGGWLAWHTNRKLRAAGQSRVVAALPSKAAEFPRSPPVA